MNKSILNLIILIFSIFIITGSGSIAEPVSENKTNFKLKPKYTLAKAPSNPIKNWSYDPYFSDYYSVCQKARDEKLVMRQQEIAAVMSEYAKRIQDYENWKQQYGRIDYEAEDMVVQYNSLKDFRPTAKDFRFTSAPIKYWLQPLHTHWRDQVKNAIQNLKKYFPLQEVDNRTQADLIIEAIEATDEQSVQKFCGTATGGELLGCGGGYFDINSRYQVRYVGYLVLLRRSLDTPITTGVVLHELGHTFGIGGHSENPDDAMFESVSYDYDQDSQKIVRNAKEQSVEEANSYTPRDLNTLYAIYNQ